MVVFFAFIISIVDHFGYLGLSIGGCPCSSSAPGSGWFCGSRCNDRLGLSGNLTVPVDLECCRNELAKQSKMSKRKVKNLQVGNGQY